jgi:hypothetical protein
MANEQEKNVTFIQLIENQTCLYDIKSCTLYIIPDKI